MYLAGLERDPQFISSSFFVVAQPVKFFAIRFQIESYLFPVGGRFFSWAKKRMAGIASAPPYPIPTPYFTNAGDLPPGYEESTNPN
ncbi:unnamed protein product [Dracunculus medinensis]|uniref:Uncharacterized protein n=1 Tax=Dracunculus medinensis TaxID=318479 RepID=A0A0N4U1P1_DRAME|nr:unnamed protein product [Dracunculus medinensis]